jgi:glycerol-3-phosphate dehydrogenase
MPLQAAGAAPDESAALDIDPEVVKHIDGIYGRDAEEVISQRRLHPNALERIHPKGPDVWAQVHHAVEQEWSMTVDDVVRRRTTLAVRGLASDAVRVDVERVIGRAQLTGTTP